MKPGAPPNAQGGQKPVAVVLPETLRAILNAAPDSVTTFENVTAAFYSLVQSLPAGHLRGRTVLVGADCFPSNHFLLNGMAEAHGFTLKTVAFRQGAAHVEDEDFLDAWTPDVGLALLTWVSSTTSHRIDLDALIAHGRQMGSLIGVDITQAAGLLPFDVTAPDMKHTSVHSPSLLLCLLRDRARHNHKPTNFNRAGVSPHCHSPARSCALSCSTSG